MTKDKIEKFDGTGDYIMWKEKLLAHLILKDVVEGLEEVMDNESKAMKVKRAKARATIILGVDEDIMRMIIKEETAAGMISVLDKQFMTQSLPKRFYLKERLYCYKMDDGMTLRENINDFLKLIADLGHVEVTIPQEDQVIIFLRALPKEYDQLKDTLKYAKSSLSLDDVIGAIRSKELELGAISKEFGATSKVNDSNSAGLIAENRGRNGKDSNQEWKPRYNNHSRSKPRSNANKNNTCFSCGKEGHWRRECPERWDNRKPSNANVASRIEEPMVLSASESETKGEWIMDSGCSFHVTFDKDSLFDFEEFEGGKVRMGNNTYSEVKGVGKVKILNPDESVVILTDVRYMPSMGRNLISYGQLEKKGCYYEGRGFGVTFYKQGRKVISGKYVNGLYHLQGKIVQGESLFSVAFDEKSDSSVLKVSECGLRLVKKGDSEELGEDGLTENLESMVKKGLLGYCFGKCRSLLKIIS